MMDLRIEIAAGEPSRQPEAEEIAGAELPSAASGNGKVVIKAPSL